MLKFSVLMKVVLERDVGARALPFFYSRTLLP